MEAQTPSFVDSVSFIVPPVFHRKTMAKFPLLERLHRYPKLIVDPDKFLSLREDERIHQYFAWARERHSIFLKKTFYEVPPPWSDFPHMSQTRWCNVYRELDKVTVQLVNMIYRPFVYSQDLWFAAMICRYINHPDSIQDLLDAGQMGLKGKWDWEAAAEVLDKRKKSGQKFVTGAYLVNSVSSADFPSHIIGSKPHVIAYRLSKAWERRDELRGEFKSTLKRAYEAYSSVSGFGPFLSYQALVDLTYSVKWLKNAPDYNEFNSAGPGTKRGVMRVRDGTRKGTFGTISQEEVTDFLRKMVKCSRSTEFWPSDGRELNPGNGWAPLSMSNLSNMMCEFDKHARLILEEGTTRSKYSAKLI